MINTMKDESLELVSKLNELKLRLEDAATFTNVASNDVIKTVALSKEISEDIKEVLIVLQTTMTTEFTATKAANYKTDSNMLLIIGDATKLLSKVIDMLANVELNKPTATIVPKWDFVKEYKKPISIILVVTSLWILGVMNTDVMDHVLKNIFSIIKGV